MADDNGLGCQQSEKTGLDVLEGGGYGSEGGGCYAGVAG